MKTLRDFWPVIGYFRVVMGITVSWGEFQLMALFFIIIFLNYCVLLYSMCKSYFAKKKGFTHSRALGGSSRNASHPTAVNKQTGSGYNERWKTLLKLFFILPSGFKMPTKSLADLNLALGCYLFVEGKATRKKRATTNITKQKHEPEQRQEGEGAAMLLPYESQATASLIFKCCLPQL